MNLVSAGSSGSSAASALVTPLPGPHPPSGAIAVAGNASATVSWTAASGATSYTVTAAPGGFTCTTASSPCNVTGLTNGTSYTFTVTATSSLGTSGPSAASTGVTPLASSDAGLAALVLTTGALSPAFGGGTTAYTAYAGWTTSTVSVTSTTSQANATIRVRINGGGYAPVVSGVASTALSLDMGGNSVDVAVTAQDGVTTRNYSITITRAVPPVIVPPTATSTQPVSDVIYPDIAGTLTAQLVGATTQHLVIVSVPTNATTGTTTFKVYSYGSASAVDSGFIAVRIEAVGLADNSLIRTFAKPLEIQFSGSTSSSRPAWSIDGQNWTMIPELAGPTLPDGQSDGYFVNADGSESIFTRHLTIFGQLMTQAPLTLGATDSDMTVKGRTELSVLGGSGAGVMEFLSQSPSVCSVTSSGSVIGLSSGNCLVIATKLAADTYQDASTIPVTITVWRSKLTLTQVRHYRYMRRHWLPAA